mmetsp:Transcript_12524/g.16037  ORF Transcript_12524/g.16037 Transcript_12524/m.16037 type:complete len:201 (+) Transcript_12524:943-1545(+)
MDSPTSEDEDDSNDDTVNRSSKIRDISAGFESVSLDETHEEEPEEPEEAKSALPLISEEEFKRLSCCGKLGQINRLLYAICKQNKLFPVLFFASAVTRLYYCMFSTFWILYLTSYVGTYLKDDDEVSALYAKLMIVSVVIGLAFSPVVGFISDRTSPLITIPCSFMVRAISIGLFVLIKDPTHVYAFGVGALLVLGTTCE